MPAPALNAATAWCCLGHVPSTLPLPKASRADGGQAGRTQRCRDVPFQRYDKFAITLSTGDTLVKEPVLRQIILAVRVCWGAWSMRRALLTQYRATAQASVIAV